MSKILIFSDTHFSPKFHSGLYEKLAGLIGQADEVIINGDFWEGYFYSFDQFVNSPWKKLFPLLKEKKTIYLPGNHDPLSELDTRTSLFSSKVQKEYEFRSGNTVFVCTHGDQYIESPGKKSILIRSPFWSSLLYAVYYSGMWLFRDRFWEIYRFENRRLQKIQKQKYQGKVLVTGHTHLMDNQENYVNLGLMTFGFFQYTWIENGRVQQNADRYDTSFFV